MFYATKKNDYEAVFEPLGTFRLVERSARIGRNPKTNEPISIPAKITMGFKTSKSAEEKLK